MGFSMLALKQRKNITKVSWRKVAGALSCAFGGFAIK